MENVVFHTPGILNKIKNRKELEGKTSKELLLLFKASSEKILYVTTPYYSESLPMDAQPLQIVPNLVLQTHPSHYGPPSYFLSAKNDDEIFSLFINPIPSNESEIDITMPLIKSNFNLKTTKNGSDIFQIILSCFEFEPIGPSTDSFDLDDTADHIFTMFRNKHIDFHFQLSDKALKTIQHRGNIISEILNTEDSYLKCLAELSNYWRNKFTRLRIFTKEELEHLFKDIPAMINTHTLFYNNLIERNQKYASVVGDVFLYFSDTFKI